jgi:hypothetical protein
MGRAKEIYKRGGSVEEVISLYNSLGTVEKVAANFNLSPRTIRKYLKGAGVEMKRGRRFGVKVGSVKHHSALIDWIKENPEIELPRSVPEISALTGCSTDVVKSYLKRRRERVLDYVETLPNLLEKSLLLYDTKGNPIPTKAFEWYIRSVDKYGLDIIIRARLKNGKSHVFRNSMEEWEEILNPQTNRGSSEKIPD